jgi:hypothetical protein
MRHEASPLLAPLLRSNVVRRTSRPRSMRSSFKWMERSHLTINRHPSRRIDEEWSAVLRAARSCFASDRRRPAASTDGVGSLAPRGSVSCRDRHVWVDGVHVMVSASFSRVLTHSKSSADVCDSAG